MSTPEKNEGFDPHDPNSVDNEFFALTAGLGIEPTEVWSGGFYEDRLANAEPIHDFSEAEPGDTLVLITDHPDSTEDEPQKKEYVFTRSPLEGEWIVQLGEELLS